jgi:hypothetical protein
VANNATINSAAMVKFIIRKSLVNIFSSFIKWVWNIDAALLILWIRFARESLPPFSILKAY